MNVLIVHDEISDASRPDEADALVQAQAVAQALADLGHTSRTCGVSLNLSELAARLERERPDLVFNLVESLAGWGRLIYLVPALLDTQAVAYTGVRSDGMYLTSNKVLAKDWLHARGIATPAWQSLRGAGGRALVFPCRVIIKSVWEDASVGLDDDAVVDVGSAEEVAALLLGRAHRLGGEAFAEAYIEGRELNLSLLADGAEAEVLPAAEIEFLDFPPGKPRIVGYAAKWATESHEYLATPRRFGFAEADASLLAEVAKLARACWRLFDLRGYARVDFRVDGDARPWILEVNANPCLSPDAGLAAAAERAGLTLTAVIERIVADGLRDAASRVAADATGPARPCGGAEQRL